MASWSPLPPQDAPLQASSKFQRPPEVYLKTCSQCKVKARHFTGESSSRGMCCVIWKYLQCSNCGLRTDLTSVGPRIVDLDN